MPSEDFFERRRFHAFLSHAHADKEIVDQIDYFLSRLDGVRIWYDARNMQPGTFVASALADALIDCRATIIALSESTLRSGWVKQEYDASLAQRAANPSFRIVPIRLDRTDVPTFLQTTLWIDLANGLLDRTAARRLLRALYPGRSSADAGLSRDIYVSRSWRPAEMRTGDAVCGCLRRAGFRLVSDALDQRRVYDRSRVRDILLGCGALVAILPDRGDGATAGPILDSIAMARELPDPLPILIIAEPDVRLPLEAEDVVRLGSAGDPVTLELERRVEELGERWRDPPRPAYAFLGHPCGQALQAQRAELIQEVVEYVAGIPCEIGDRPRGDSAIGTIADRIRGASFAIFDMADGNMEACIGAGIAIGAQVPTYILAPDSHPGIPAMLQHLRWERVDGELALIAAAHNFAFRHRRLILTGST